MAANKFAIIMVLTVLFGQGLAACDYNDGPAEKAGEKLDQSVDNAGDKMEELGDKAKDAVDQ